MSNKLVTATKDAEIDEINNTTAKDMTTTVREIEAERAEKERLADLAEQRVNDAPGSENAKAIQKDKEIAEAERLHNEQINNPTADDIAKKGKLQLAKEKAEKDRQAQIASADRIGSKANNDNKELKSLADKLEQNRQNELKKEIATAERIGSKMDRDNNGVSGRGTLRFGRHNPFRFSTLSYPRNVTNNLANGHYLLFYVNVQNKTGFKYEGVTPTDGDFSIGDWIETTYGKDEDSYEGAAFGKKSTIFTYEKGANKGEIGYQKRQVLAGAKGNILRHNQKILSKGRKTLTGMESVHKTTTRITDSVAMYLPPNVQNDTSVQYQGFETGLAGFLALGGKGILDKIVNQDYAGAAGKFTSMAGATLKELLKKVGVEAITAFTGGQGIQQAFDKAFGNTLNPYLEVAFESMGVRSFNYEFTFSPRNAEEAQDAKDIIELFRFHMAPELKGSQHRYLTLPSTFDIHYMYQTSVEDSRENDFYNKIATCVLTKCSVNYTPGAVQSFDSGSPVSTTMSLEFMETEMLTKEKIQQGF
jgi:hypothetical protein